MSASKGSNLMPARGQPLLGLPLVVTLGFLYHEHTIRRVMALNHQPPSRNIRRMKAWRTAALIAWPTSLGLIALLVSLLGPSAARAQTPWPTPPPAPIGAFPQVIPASEITPVPAPTSPGSIALQVDPIFAGRVPRIPPRPSTTILSGEADTQDRITLHIDAGAIDRTLQLSYEPLAIDQVSHVESGRQIQRAFRLQAYDQTASVMTVPFQYPVRLSLHVQARELATTSNDPARLLLARFDTQHNRWLPLVTTYQATDATLMVRILQPGLFALIAQPPPVTS